MPMDKKLTRAEQKALRPVQILEAAFEEFIAKGFSATRVEDVADRVGVTKGTVYVYFDTKEKLFESMVDHVSGPFQESVSRLDIDDGNPLVELEAVLRFLFDQIVENRRMRELLRLVVSEGRTFPDLIDRHHLTFMEPVITRIDAILDKGSQSGVFRRGKSAELSKVIMAPVIGTVVIRLIFDDRQPLDSKEVLSAHLELLMNGLKATVVTEQ